MTPDRALELLNLIQAEHLDQLADQDVAREIGTVAAVALVDIAVNLERLATILRP